MFGVASYVTLFGVSFGVYGSPGVDYVADEVILAFKASTPALAREALTWSLGAYAIAQDGDSVTLKLPRGLAPSAALGRLARSPYLEFAEPNYLAHAASKDDPAYSSQYGIVQTFCNAAWEREDGGYGATIAVLDTGIDREHPEFAFRTLPGYDFVNKDANPADDNGHGTLCAGIAAAAADNGIGIAGVAYRAAILPVKVLDRQSKGSYSNIAQGIRWAADQGADVISMSLAGSSSSSTLKSALEYAVNKGVVVVAAAGNGGNTRKMYPAAYPLVVSVSAVDRRKRRPSYATYGSWVDVAAPGDAIYSTYPGSTFRTANGTSMASAFVAGQAALIRAYVGPEASGRDIARKIEQTSVKLGTWTRYGLVNVYRSLSGDGG
ncbi:MAG TPA: S8 family serine peptidase [Fimbriimonadaceae bacterium]|nr:S8 family serine peptidase [Fimbriimonadaceae bacterium]